MTEPPSESEWPTREDTFAGPPAVPPAEPVQPVAPPPEPYGPPRPDDRRIGAGMLLALGAIALVAAGIVLAYLATHRGSDKGTTTTVVLSTAEQPTTAAVASPVTKAPTTTAAKTTSPATTAATTTTATTSATSTAKTTTPQTTTTAAPPTPTNATVPDVSGMDEQAAAGALNNANVLASFAFVPSSDTLGTVEQQAKPPGTSVPYHAHVQINVSKGPNATTDESVPNTIGQTLSQAVATLNAGHLRLIYVKLAVTSRSQAGKVVQQSPLAGGKAPQNAQILVFLGAFRAG